MTAAEALAALEADTARQHQDVCGPFDRTKKQAKHQPSCDCGAPAEIIWKDDLRNSDTWFYQQCVDCDADVCPDCYATDNDEPVCDTCYALRRHIARKGDSPTMKTTLQKAATDAEALAALEADTARRLEVLEREKERLTREYINNFPHGAGVSEWNKYHARYLALCEEKRRGA